MPVTPIDMADAAELAELLQLIAGWLASDPATLGASLLKFTGHPAYGTQDSATTCTASPSSPAAPTGKGCSAPRKARYRPAARGAGPAPGCRGTGSRPGSQTCYEPARPRDLMTGNQDGAKTP